MLDRIDAILETRAAFRSDGEEIGCSREGRPIRAFRLGRGPRRVSLIGGCHADEPVGPRLLRHLAGYLASLPERDPLLHSYEWWVLPHVNPDGEERNRAWHGDDDPAFDFTTYLGAVSRELPGDDIEFGFPRNEADTRARPENVAAYTWWRSAGGSFALHMSLHGMAFAAGPWFLIDEAWQERSALLMDRCRAGVAEMGYSLHDVERRGEKGFFRLGRGFSTRPNSLAMRDHFLGLGDPDTAARFQPSSMETIRSLGGDPLTLVSEMPLFLTPGVGVDLGPPDPVAGAWKERIADWSTRLHSGEDRSVIAEDASTHGLRPMPVRDQMVLQWSFIAVGVEQVALDANESVPGLY